jgi:hypothetical protein
MEGFILGGMSCMVASFFTNPVDVIKVRMQIKGETLKDLSNRPSFSTTAVEMGRKEGLKSFYRGLAPSLLRESTYSTIRMGLYGHFKGLFANNSSGKEPMWKLIVAGGLSGGIGSIIANPTDIVKVKIQASTLNSSLFQVIRNIYKTDGVFGFYRGGFPSSIRAIILTASQLPSYEFSKSFIKEYNFLQESIQLHFVCSMFAGLVCATTTAPIDLVKSRYMSQSFKNGRGQLYSSMVDCFIKTFKNEGYRGFYSGWLAQWLRLGPHTIITFVVLEQLRLLFNYKPF